MSTETILNILVGAVAVNAIASSRYRVAERRIKSAEFGASYNAYATLSALVMLALWIWLAFVTDRWQFAAIVGLPALVLIGSLAASPKPASSEREGQR